MPLLFTNPLLFLFVILILAGVFRDYNTLEDVFATKPP
jgi:hypothetical protein